ncbi:hypothetical protein EV702DRAFT_1164927 [Suillus placidus]|uniref:Uncharacterized protein n=1 Tax=Suillus placidus TaxID=48579 RepID=A0A9P6ZFD9_9AGAM|nr:hypothetical protein EV702DRAFT_1164927 [Suillus placidus]
MSSLPQPFCYYVTDLQPVIPGQDQDGHDAEPDFFQGIHEHPQIARPRPQQRPGRFKRLRLAVTRSPRSGPPPAPAQPTTLSPAAAPTTFKAQLRHLFIRRSNYAAPPIIDVPFTQAKEHDAAAGAPKPDDDLVPDDTSVIIHQAPIHNNNPQ